MVRVSIEVRPNPELFMGIPTTDAMKAPSSRCGCLSTIFTKVVHAINSAISGPEYARWKKDEAELTDALAQIATKLPVAVAKPTVIPTAIPVAKPIKKTEQSSAQTIEERIVALAAHGHKKKENSPLVDELKAELIKDLDAKLASLSKNGLIKLVELFKIHRLTDAEKKQFWNAIAKRMLQEKDGLSDCTGHEIALVSQMCSEVTADFFVACAKELLNSDAKKIKRSSLQDISVQIRVLALVSPKTEWNQVTIELFEKVAERLTENGARKIKGANFKQLHEVVLAFTKFVRTNVSHKSKPEPLFTTIETQLLANEAKLLKSASKADVEQMKRLFAILERNTSHWPQRD